MHNAHIPMHIELKAAKWKSCMQLLVYVCEYGQEPQPTEEIVFLS